MRRDIRAEPAGHTAIVRRSGNGRWRRARLCPPGGLRMPLLGMTPWLHTTERPGGLVMMLMFAIAVCVTLVLWAGFAWTLLAAASSRDRRRPVSPVRRMVRH